MAAFSVVLPIALAACGSGSLSTPSTGSSSSAAATTAAASPTAPPTATPTSNPAATPNPGRGQFLLYESSGAWVVKSDGTGKRKVSDGSPVGWSHDGSMVHLATDATKSGCQVTQLSDLPIDGGAETDIPASFKHGDWDFDWSPDDTRIAFFRPTIQRQCGPQTNPDSRMDLMVVDADGTHQRKLAIGVPDGAGASFVWTPDSRSILVIQQDDDPPHAGPIVSIDVVTSAPNQITAASGSYVDAAVSPNGSQIAFVAGAGGYDATHVANIDGSGDRNLGDSSSTDHLVSWSPAGSSLAVLRGDRHDGPTHLVVAVSPSAPLRDLYNPLAWKGAGPKISWSPDAARVACIADAGGIVVVATDGSGASPIPNAAGATDVFWQP
jgi:Tol biopolymer transport system component